MTQHSRSLKKLFTQTQTHTCIFSAAGDAVFKTHENLEHMAMMGAVLGPMPGSLIARAAKVPANAPFLHKNR